MKPSEWLARFPFCGTSFVVVEQTFASIGDAATRFEEHLVDAHRTPRDTVVRYAQEWGRTLVDRGVPNRADG